MATQLGMENGKNVASADTKVIVPRMESFTVAEGGKYTLKHKAIAAPAEIYEINEDSTFGIKYKNGANEEPAVTAPTAELFVYTEADNTINLPTDLKVGTEMFVMYEYESENAVEVVNSAKNFPVGCKFIMEVLGCDVCDQTNLIYAYVIFNNAKLSPDFDWSIATDGAHPFSMRAQQDYCDKEKRLFSIVIPGDQE